MKHFLVVSSLLCAVALAENGPYGAPSIESLDQLSEAQKGLFTDSMRDLFRPDFVNRKGLRVSPSFYATPEGLDELRSVAADLYSRRDEYSRVLSVGRSGTGILTYLSARLAAEGHSVRIGDIPFSLGRTEALSASERAALRQHFEVNGLTPASIAALEKPILCFDFVLSGKGAHTVLMELHRWAEEVGMGAAVRARLHFHGLYPAEMMSGTAMMDIYYASLKEGMRSQPPSREDIVKAALALPLPNEDRFRAVCGKVTSRRISSSFYGYAGTHGPTSHESFVRERWTTAVDRERAPRFADHLGEPAFVELFYLAGIGRQDVVSKLKTCQDVLKTLAH